MFDPAWIRAVDPGHFWPVVFLIWGAASVAFLAVWHFYTRLRLVEDTPKSLIRSAAQGYVELAGTSRLMSGEPIVAPLSGVRCIWWSYSIEQMTGSRRSRWETMKHEVSGELFLIEDDTGRCVVDPDKAEVYPSAKDVWYGDSPMPEGGPKLGSFALASRYRYTESRIQDGDPLYALGYFHTQGPPSAGDIDDEVRQQLAAWKRDQPWLMQHFDTNHDGQIDQQEWEVARQEARRLVLEQERDNLKRPPVNVLSRAPDGRDFILSTLPQKNLETRLRLYAIACLLAFFCAGAGGSYLLGVRLSAPAAGIHGGP